MYTIYDNIEVLVEVVDISVLILKQWQRLFINAKHECYLPSLRHEPWICNFVIPGKWELDEYAKCFIERSFKTNALHFTLAIVFGKETSFYNRLYVKIILVLWTFRLLTLFLDFTHSKWMNPFLVQDVTWM